MNITKMQRPTMEITMEISTVEYYLLIEAIADVRQYGQGCKIKDDSIALLEKFQVALAKGAPL